MKDTENRPPSRKRRKWGSVIVRRDTDGNPTSFQARYVNPLDPPKKVGRNFGLEYETEAYKWLDEEHYLVTLHNKGIRQWVHPSQRGAGTMPTFREYSKDYFDGYRKPDGSKLSGRFNRCNEIVLRRLNEAFGDTPLDRITRQMVDEWYVNARDELTAWTFEQAARTLKRVMLAAATEQADGTPPLIPASPCRYRVIKPQSKRRVYFVKSVFRVGGGDVLLDFVVCMVVRNDSTRVQATSPSSMRLSMMLMPYSSLMRLSLYQTMHSSNNVTNSSIETPWKLRLWKNSCLPAEAPGGCVVRTAALRAHRPRQAVAPADADPLCTSR